MVTKGLDVSGGGPADAWLEGRCGWKWEAGVSRGKLKERFVDVVKREHEVVRERRVCSRVE